MTMRNLKGIPESKYICATCKQEKDSIEFHWYAQTIDGRGRRWTYSSIR